ncbi:MAG TPA: M20 family metallo-hydrolase [Clostridia bacterium]|nr:M20 family metallo-hydrolase [Clostridia bacterium]
MNRKDNIGNIKRMLEELSRFNSTPEFGITRVLFTPVELQGREYVKNEMRKLELEIEEDSIGNIYGIYKGSEPELPQVWTGSHEDTVPNAGMFDGTVGVLGGLEAVRILKESGFRPKRSIAVVLYTSEEPTRFGIGCLGSRALSGRLSLEETKLYTDAEGNSLYAVLESLGYDTSTFDQIEARGKNIYASVELHVEQSKILDREKVPIGIVKTICAHSNFEIEITGCQSHAGATSMEDRRDAFCAASEIALELEKLAGTSTSEYTTVTVGKVQVVPNASNVIPGKVNFSVDIRDCNFDSKQKLTGDMRNMISSVARKRNVSAVVADGNNDYPVSCDKKIMEIIEESCRKRKLEYRKVISGAFHDSMMIGLIAPVAMIFVPSRNGISHSPDEWTDFEDIANGVFVLADTLMELSME